MPEHEDIVRKGFDLTGPPDEEGNFEAIVAVYDTVDRQKEVVTRGAFREGQEAIVSASMRHGDVMFNDIVGKGAVFDQGDHARIRGKFLMRTQAGRDAREVALETMGLMGWSYGARVLERGRTPKGHSALKSLDVFEWTITNRPVGYGTGTVAVKSEGADPPPADPAPEAPAPAEAPPPAHTVTPYPLPDKPVEPRVPRRWEEL